jgi:hypothetical protein
VEQSFQKRAWMNIGIIAAAFVVFGLVFYLLGNQLDATSQIIALDRNEAAGRSYALENLSTLKTQEPLAAQYKQKIDALLPSQDGLFAFINYVQAVGKIHQVDITFAYSGAAIPPTASGPGYILFNATVAGSIQNIYAFLADIESMSTLFMVNVDSLDMTTDGSNYRAALQGKVFFK